MRQRRPSPFSWWAAAAALALLAAATWLRGTAVEYLVATGAATVASIAALRAMRGGRGWPLVVAGATAAFCAVAAWAQWELWRVEHHWPAYSEDVSRQATAMLQREVDQLASTLRREAENALQAPADSEAAFHYIAVLGGPPVERGLVVFRGERAIAWAGRTHVVDDTTRASLGVAESPFYVELFAVAESDSVRALATALVHAKPPADRLGTTLESLVTRRTQVKGFEFTEPVGDERGGGVTFAPDGVPLFDVRPLPLVQGQVRLRVVEQARLRGGLLLAVALAAFLGVTWRRSRLLRFRLAVLAAALAAVALVPLNAYSNASRLFDPAIYYAPLGGPFTASAGALGITSALLLLGLLALLRARSIRGQRSLSLVAVLLVAALGPFLLRDLARGIALPPSGATAGLWLAWQVPLFLAAVCVLIAGASAGQAALGGRRGLPPAAAPALAALGALLGPATWEAPGRFPGWYPALWIAAIASLALARRSRHSVLAAAAVAALGAVTLVWGATARQRVAQATRDVTSLFVPDSSAAQYLERFGDQLTDEAAPRSRIALLQSYMRSELAAANYPVALTSWAPDGTLETELTTARFRVPTDTLAAIVAEARRGAGRILRPITGEHGTELVLVVPGGDGSATAVLVARKTGLITAEPYAALLGLPVEPVAETPYRVRLDSAVGHGGGTRAAPDTPMRWNRSGSELHGDVGIRAGARRVHAHAVVRLRPFEALVPRGALIVLLDLAIVYVLWMLSALAGGVVGRWLRGRRRVWARSYRARLTIALFAFFVIPAATFAVWAYRQLRDDDRQSRELLVGETLRTAARGVPDSLEREARTLETPLFRYRGGVLLETSDTLFSALAPLGRHLAPRVLLALGGSGGAEFVGRLEPVGAGHMLFGYRSVGSEEGTLAVLAAPAPTNAEMVDERRRDLGILVLFATALGALAALALSGFAARQLASPIGELRRAALAIAAANRAPPLAAAPPSEFLPVFDAFRRMAEDLGASRAALEEATRRTAAVLRNVASGVVAVDRDGVVTLANPRADALLGCPLPPGTPLDGCGAPALAARLAAFLAGDDDEEDFEVELGPRQLRGRLTRLRGGTGGAVLTLDDVTELARAQRVLAWGEMARQVAHEIKNPLTPIRLGVQHLRRARAAGRPDFDAILEQNITRILDEIDRLDEIARTFSRYGMAPAEQPAPEPTDIAAVVRAVVDLETMGVGDVEWRLTGAEAPLVAMARAGELREVLLNVLENARLAGARRVEVSVARRDDRVVVAVEDDGHGIPAHVLPRIFEPHFSTRTSGSGLGLATSRRLVDGWGGSIAVTSERGRGTRVEIALQAA